jgi:hypothetical protein
MLATSNYTKVIVFFISFYTLLIESALYKFCDLFKNLSPLKYIFISVLPFFSVVRGNYFGIFAIISRIDQR